INKCIEDTSFSDFVSLQISASSNYLKECRTFCVQKRFLEFAIAPSTSDTLNCVCGSFDSFSSATCGSSTTQVYQILDKNGNIISFAPLSSSEAETLSSIFSQESLTAKVSDSITSILSSSSTTNLPALSSGSSAISSANSSVTAEVNHADITNSNNTQPLPVGVIVSISLFAFLAVGIVIYGVLLIKKKKEVLKSGDAKNYIDIEKRFSLGKLTDAAVTPIPTISRSVSSISMDRANSRSTKRQSGNSSKRQSGNSIKRQSGASVVPTFSRDHAQTPLGFLYRRNSSSSLKSAFFPLDLDRDSPAPPMPSLSRTNTHSQKKKSEEVLTSSNEPSPPLAAMIKRAQEANFEDYREEDRVSIKTERTIKRQSIPLNDWNTARLSSISQYSLNSENSVSTVKEWHSAPQSFENLNRPSTSASENSRGAQSFKSANSEFPRSVSDRSFHSIVDDDNDNFNDKMYDSALRNVLTSPPSGASLRSGKN
ncbi:hypothetical protein HK096_007620, partial [Nowakowskiella sp. JEL0078]